MPIRYLPIKKGYQFGTTGKIYLTKDYGKKGAYDKSLQQSKAIKASQARQGLIKIKASSRAKGYERRV